MFGRSEKLKEMLKQLEALKVGIMREINSLNGNKEAVFPTTVYPMAKVKPMIINGYPVFQFGYEGMLPHFKEDDKEYLRMIRYYYFRSTFDSYDFDKIDFKFDNVVIIFVQYFKNHIIRDLENRNKKYIQDAIRHAGLIKDDNWQNVWNMDLGFHDDEEDHVQVYVVSRDCSADFYSYLLENHDELKASPNVDKEQAFLEYQEILKQKEMQKREEEKQENEALFLG